MKWPPWDEFCSHIHENIECRLQALSMRKTGCSDFQRRAERVERCGSPEEYYTKWGEEGIRVYRCGDRLCPCCARVLSKRDRNRVFSMLSKMDKVWFVTLTTNSVSQSDIPNAMDYLSKSFVKLRQRKFWKKNTRWGIRCFELMAKKKGFRPHLHLLLDTKSIPVEEISIAWRTYTMGAGTVDCRGPVPASDFGKVAQYVTKWYGRLVLREYSIQKRQGPSERR